ncbi:MAG: exodeoxyribonuclease VII large subunit [Nitrospiraceae bacterium]|nr:exodeoxyribonuclease VII large subunit [Nitrospiraceae bacterium]
MPVPDRPQRILTVSALTALVRERLEEGFSDCWVEGEVSNLRTPSSGHIYFTLKDATSQIRVVLFRPGAQRLRFALKEGLQLVVRGRLTVYEPRGEYQIVLDYLEPKGLGALQLALEQLKERLAREGLFEQARKRPLPFLPRRVGVVTSLTGAALRDILAVLRRRCPIVGIVVAPVPVQGDDAAAQIASAIRALSASKLVDVMIVGRGGGSLEDLWSFNEEIVVRAIAASDVPVVSAVGHEIDYTLADFVADYRAPTPSAAAEAVAPVLRELVGSLEDSRERMVQAVKGRLLERTAQQVDEAAARVGYVVRALLATLHRRTTESRHRLQAASPVDRVRAVSALLPQLVKRVRQGMATLLTVKRQTVRTAMTALDGLSPLAVLARGYSIVQTVPDGAVLKRAQDVSVGDDVLAKLADGRLLCSVRKILPNS